MTHISHFVNWMVQDALPVWSTAGFDEVSGRFHERLDQDAMPLPVPQRAMVQARQIQVFAAAYRQGWCDSGATIAETAMRSLVRDYCTESARTARFAFSISTGGRVLNDSADSYTHGFVLFAIASLYAVTQDPQLLRLAHKVTAFIKKYLIDPVNGGVSDTFPIGASNKRQNPQMHLLEGYLALERAAPGSGFLEEAATVVDLFTERMFDSAHGILPEFFTSDWSTLTSASGKLTFEPGHQFEWVWLLHEFEILSGKSRSTYSDALFRNAMKTGVTGKGLIYDETCVDGSVVAESFRIWPHTEAIKALAVRTDGDFTERASVFAHALLYNFLQRPFRGGWIDHIDRAKKPLVTYIPASSLYHLFFAASEAERVMTSEAAAPHAAAMPTQDGR